MDSNHDKQIQNLQCYRYTTRQFNPLNLKGLQKYPPRLPYFSKSGNGNRWGKYRHTKSANQE